AKLFEPEAEDLLCVHRILRGQCDLAEALAQSAFHARLKRMKESVLDVLMYLFENYRLGEYSDADNHLTLRTELLGAGFPDDEIAHAFRWLDGLGSEGQLPLQFGPGRSIRVYAKEELDKLPTECRGFLMYL